MIGIGSSFWLSSPVVAPETAGIKMLCDFTTGFAVLDEQVVEISDIFKCTRTTDGYLEDGTAFSPDELRLSSRGVLIEESRENFVLNSFSPVDQTIALAADTYTLSVGAGGSASITGDSTASATGGNAASFTLGAAGSVDLVVSGNPLWVQIEAGAFATSPIVTTTSSATRSYDRVQPLDLTWFTPDDMVLTVEWEQRQSGSYASNGVSNVVRWAGDAGYSRIRAGSTTFAQIRNEAGTLGLNSGAPGATVPGIHTMTLTSNATDFKIEWSDSFNGTAGSATSENGPCAQHVSSLNIGGNMGGEFINGWIRKLSLT